jgi:NAD(P) transhydrogenase subunit alpha
MMSARILQWGRFWLPVACVAIALASFVVPSPAGSSGPTAGESTAAQSGTPQPPPPAHGPAQVDYWPLLFVFLLATFIGVGVIQRVSRLLHTPLMSITNAISAIAVVGSIIVTGSDYPLEIRIMGAVALFASTTNIVSGFLITDRMLKMFKTPGKGGKP